MDSRLCSIGAPIMGHIPRRFHAQSGLAFEDAAGTLGFLTNIPCDGSPVAALEIRRTAPNPNGGNQ
jgi:hypothetical protein